MNYFSHMVEFVLCQGRERGAGEREGGGDDGAGDERGERENFNPFM